jgi:hypothetical protein
MIVRNILVATLLILPLPLFGESPAKDGTPAPQAAPQLKVFTNSGTMNRLAMFGSDGTTVIDSNVYQVGSKIGINTSSIVNMLTIDAGAATSDGIRLSRVSQTANPYVDITLNTTATPFGMIQVGDGIMLRPLVLQPNGGKIGVNTVAPTAPLHLYSSAAGETYMAFGPDSNAGPAFNIGYSGTSYGRGSAFLNVRPDASATAPNPSLRFLTLDVLRMIITNTGRVGIGTAAPSHPFDVYGPATLIPGGAGSVREVFGVYDSSTFGADVGGSIVFGGKYNAAGAYAQQFASIQGYKETAADGDDAGGLLLHPCQRRKSRRTDAHHQ